MDKVPIRLLEEALKLPQVLRSALAASLLESLDEIIDPDAEAEWAAEIARRVNELEAGYVQAVPWVEARRLILER